MFNSITILLITSMLSSATLFTSYDSIALNDLQTKEVKPATNTVCPIHCCWEFDIRGLSRVSFSRFIVNAAFGMDIFAWTFWVEVFFIYVHVEMVLNVFEAMFDKWFVGWFVRLWNLRDVYMTCTDRYLYTRYIPIFIHSVPLFIHSVHTGINSNVWNYKSTYTQYMSVFIPTFIYI